MKKYRKEEYETYYRLWLEGIKPEIQFWDKLISTKGESINAKEIFELRMSPFTRFSLEDECESKIVDFCDVGSGPFSNIGYCTEQIQLNITAVDPLARAYHILKDKYNIISPIQPITGMVELLDCIFERNSFDIVHMSNSLDHCYDPLEGIYQMLNVCKMGGKIILRHNENEAEKEKYKGFHQWNIHLNEKNLIIWKDNYFIDVGKEIGDFATIETAKMKEENILEDTWLHNYFVIRKTNEEIPVGKYKKYIIRELLEAVVEMAYFM